MYPLNAWSFDLYISNFHSTKSAVGQDGNYRLGPERLIVSSLVYNWKARKNKKE